MKEWMVLFRKYLITSYPASEQGGAVGSEDELAVVDSLRVAICDILSLYMDRNEEPFKEYVDEFGRAVRDLLVDASLNAGREQLAITAMKFLITLSMQSPLNFLFSDDASLFQICWHIVAPNVMIREEEEDLFSMNYVEFIRRDMEGSDLDTRRRIAGELLKAIAVNYRDRVMQVSLGLIQGMILDSSNWKCKDCAIYLVLSLTSNNSTGGYSGVPTGFIDDFFAKVIVPELQSQDVNGCPFLKASALKFFTVLQSLLPKQKTLALIPGVVRFLGSEVNVVHSYSAICIDKFLLVKDGGAARYLANDIAPFFPVLMTNLFNALKFPESEDNQYIMRCIARVLAVADISHDAAVFCTTQLTSILNEVCKNPKNATFNDYLFEAVSVLVRRSSMDNPEVVYERVLPCLENIINKNVIEFFPYAFQLIAQFVELNRRPALSPQCGQIFEKLVVPDSRKKSSDVPALVRLLQAANLH